MNSWNNNCEGVKHHASPVAAGEVRSPGETVAERNFSSVDVACSPAKESSLVVAFTPFILSAVESGDCRCLPLGVERMIIRRWDHHQY